MTRYRFAEVRAALRGHWGLGLRRGGATSDDEHDEHRDAAHSRTGFVVSGRIPRRGYGVYRYATLSGVVRALDLAEVVQRARRDARLTSTYVVRSP